MALSFSGGKSNAGEGAGSVDLGFETIPGDHPVVPLMIRDTSRNAEIISWLKDHGVLATGLNFSRLYHHPGCSPKKPHHTVLLLMLPHL